MELENPFFQEVISQLNKSGVDYILIGGLAVGYYGYSRYTGDMDLWVNPESENMEKLYTTLRNMGYPEETINHISKNRDIENPTPIKLWDDSNTMKVDLMTNTFQKEFSWEECRRECKFIKVAENKFPVIHINHLIQLKKNTKRLDSSMKDLVDAAELEKIRKKDI
ncbi:MAG: nucleotidyltransferase [Cyclobacteriaceae bacterium]|nr:nucleotidyltransferase [Cyclobacteriaceae bacterium]